MYDVDVPQFLVDIVVTIYVYIFASAIWWHFRSVGVGNITLSHRIILQVVKYDMGSFIVKNVFIFTYLDCDLRVNLHVGHLFPRRSDWNVL